MRTAWIGRIACSLGIAALLAGAAAQDPKPAVDDPPLPPAHVAPEPKALTKVLKRLIELHDKERAKADAEPLEPDARLMAAALRHAQDMAKTGGTEHAGSDESTMISRSQDAGYRYRFLGENIAAGQKTPEQAMDGWMHSEGHRHNVLNPDYTQIGVAVVRSRKGVNFWCVDFGQPLVKPDKEAKKEKGERDGSKDR